MSLAMLAFHLWEHSEVGDSKYKIIKSNHPVIIILFKNSNHQLTLYNQEANRQICAHYHHLVHCQLLLHLLGQPRSSVYHDDIIISNSSILICFDISKEWHNNNCIFNCTPGEKHGTAILINNSHITILHNRMRDVEGRVIAVDINMHGVIFHLVNSYGPNHNNLKVPFLSRLYVYLSSNKHTIWAGDHNIATNPALDRFPARLCADHASREYLDLMNTFDLKDACRTLYPNGSFFTFRRGSSKSQIDKINFSSELHIESYQQSDPCLI